MELIKGMVRDVIEPPHVVIVMALTAMDELENQVRACVRARAQAKSGAKHGVCMHTHGGRKQA